MKNFEDIQQIKHFSKIKHLYSYYGEKCVRNIRFSCAYLFRIKIDGQYFLVRDEQGRNQYQPVGGVYKYNDSSILDQFEAEQCRKFRYSSDLDDDLRIIIPRDRVFAFYKWYTKQTGRENIKNLYREFKEEIIDRIEQLNHEDIESFKTIHYKYCGENIISSTYKTANGERALQIHLSDIVELILSPSQSNAFRSLKKVNSSLFYFATEEEIIDAKENKTHYAADALGVSGHSYKILPSEEKNLIYNHKKAGEYFAEFNASSPIIGIADIIEKYQSQLNECNKNKPLIFISYNSVDKQTIFKICIERPFSLTNFWIDKKNVAENWRKNVEEILTNDNCKFSVIFINEDYLRRSSACLDEARMIVGKKIPHIIYLIGLSSTDISDLIKKWISNDYADKDRLIIFKQLFSYNDNTGHIDNSIVELNDYSPIDHTHFKNFIREHGNLLIK